MAYTYEDITEMLTTVDELEKSDQRYVADGLEKFAKSQLNKKLSNDLNLGEQEAIEFLESLLLE